MQRSESVKLKKCNFFLFGPQFFFFLQQKLDIMGCGASCISLMWGHGVSQEDGGFG